MWFVILTSLSMYAGFRWLNDILPPRSNESVGIHFVRRAVVHQLNSDLDGLIWSRFDLAQAVNSSMQSMTSDFTATNEVG